MTSCTVTSTGCGSPGRQRTMCSGSGLSPAAATAAKCRNHVHGVREEQQRADGDPRAARQQAREHRDGERCRGTRRGRGAPGDGSTTSRRAPPRSTTATPVAPAPSVSSRNGEPSTAPVATESAAGEWVASATIGTTVSGSDVPSAASRLPVAPVPRLSMWPAHSIALVNSSDATTTTRIRLATKSSAVIIGVAAARSIRRVHPRGREAEHVTDRHRLHAVHRGGAAGHVDRVAHPLANPRKHRSWQQVRRRHAQRPRFEAAPRSTADDLSKEHHVTGRAEPAPRIHADDARRCAPCSRSPPPSRVRL